MFPKDFIWGVGTSDYQIEGAHFQDGRGVSTFDEFTSYPGHIFENNNTTIALDHYNRYEEDFKLLAELGVKSYRFSFNWTRIMPEGTGRVEMRAIEHYRDMVKCLLSYGIRPLLTPMIWDYPAALYRRGGWLNPESSDWYAEYVRVVAENFGDLIKDYTTLNEPSMMAGNTFLSGNLAPGILLPDGDIIRVIHNLLLAHGKAAKVIREVVPDAKVGTVLCMDGITPVEETPEEIKKAYNYYYKAGKDMDELSFGLSWYSDPMFLGKYPEDGMAWAGKYLPEGWEKDMETICQPLDYVGLNIYSGVRLMRDEEGNTVPKPKIPGYPANSLSWEIVPECLYWGARFFVERYQVPVFISENGFAAHEFIFLDGKVHDPARIDYTHRHLLGVKRAVEEGIPLIGYYHWSLLDNFEWAQGFMERFGLIFVDHTDLKRIPKDSYYWYQEVIKTNGADL